MERDQEGQARRLDAHDGADDDVRSSRLHPALTGPTGRSARGQAADMRAVQRRESPKGGDEATADETSTPAASGGGEGSTPPDIGAGDIVLTRDATYATQDYVSWFADEAKAKVTAWGLTFDASRVKLAREAQGEAKAPVIALSWDASWGDQPITKDIPLEMGPIDAKAAVAGVQRLAGWSKVASDKQSQVKALLGGETNNLSRAARDHLRSSFSGLSSKTDTQQANAIAAVVGNTDAMPGVVDEQVETTAVTFTLSAPAVVKDYAFRGKKADAEKYEASFSDGARIDIYAPKAPEAGHHQHSVNEAADAAAYLPKKSRAVVKEVVLNIVENPDDAHWAVEYNDPDFHSYMTAGASGTITIYPDKSDPQPGDNYRRGTMIHETGHTWSYQQWGTDETKGKWLVWKAAMAKDGNSVSGYAQASIAEDVAETVQIYGSTKGTPKYDEYKAIVPERMKILEAELG